MRQFFVFLLILSLCTGAVFADNQKMIALPQSNDTKYYPTNAIDNLKSVKWEETFNSTTIPAGWQVVDNDGSGAAWEYRQIITFTSGDTVNPQIDSSFWFSNFNNANGLLIDEWLISPKVAGIAAGDSLHIWAGAIDGTWKDSLKVWVSTTDSALGSFTQVGYFKVDGPLGVNNWNKYSFDLSSFAGNDIFVAANYYITNGGTSGSASDNMWLDHFAVTGQSNTVNVTFKGNASTVEGFTDSTTVIQIRGGIQEPGGPGTSWNQTVLMWSDASPSISNVGGDYWEGTIAFPDSFIGKEVNWKFGATITNLDGTTSDFWEDGGNRIFILPAVDTTLGLGYVSNDFNPPYAATDSIDVFFRINMAENPDFNPNNQTVYMVGAFPNQDGSANMWDPDNWPLTREVSGSGDYWQYHLILPVSGAPYDSTMYRFTLNDWSNSEQVFGHGMFPNNENRGTSIGLNDTTISWRWWNDVAPEPFSGNDTVSIIFSADMSTAIANNGFTPGDTVVVRAGYNSTAADVTTSGMLIKQGFTNIYAVTDTIISNLGEDLQYNYYVFKDGIDYREIFFDFNDASSGASAEKRKANISGLTMTVLDDSDDPVSLRRKPNFRNLASPSQDANVYFTCDLRPAYYQVLMGDTLIAIQGGAIFDVTNPDSVYSWGVRINGPATGGWAQWGITLREDTTGRMMYDDGTHGDEVAGDTIFTADAYTYYAHEDSNDIIGQEFKFGVAGGDNEGGYGNNHIENIDDSTPTSYLRSQFGSIDPIFYWAWDFQTQTPNGIGDENLELPKKFVLHQNFPNPFNPSTNIKFDLPNQTDVKLVIYNVLGQQVVTLVDDNLKAGDYAKTWNGLDQQGKRVATGVYFYKLVTNKHTAVKKLLMVK